MHQIMDNKLVAYLKKNERIFWALAMSCIPLISCMLYCAVQGKTLLQVSILNSGLNDELLYYKQIEAVLNYGYPLGYFGYNESQAIKASFGAWSPVVLLPCVILGGVFGWTQRTPIYCNITFMTVAMFIFVWLVKPTKKQMCSVAFLYTIFTPLTRYTLSGMQECICCSLVIIVVALAYSYNENKKHVTLVSMFVVTAFMTLMRPYLLLFMLYPAYVLIVKKKWLGVMISLLIMMLSCLGFVFFNYYFTAAYFFPIIDTTWITYFLENGVMAGVVFLKNWLSAAIVQYIRIMLVGIQMGELPGKFYIAFTILFFVMLIHLIECILKKDNKVILYSYFLICSLGTWMAILLMYKLEAGSRHLLIFLVMGIFTISMMDTQYMKKSILMICIFVILFVVSPIDRHTYGNLFDENKVSSQMEYWENVFNKECILDKKNVPSFNNSVIWVFNDLVDGEWRTTPYQILYTLPAGMGISCCYEEFVENNLQKLQSKYLAVIPNGRIDTLCHDNMREIGRDEELVVYELH